ncbi:ADP-ribosylation factor GTPase-activating protein gcs1 [Rhodosporidiobolus nylandii]
MVEVDDGSAQDKWTPAQVDRMKAGGNAKCREFFEANGQRWKGQPLADKYATHTATLYREKLLAEAEGRPWIPSSPPTPSAPSPSNGGGTGSLRKPRASGLSSASVSSTPRTGSPAAAAGAGAGAGAGGLPSREQNEDFFARMGNANASRPDHLPPSQGGKYQGFGSGGAASSSSGGQGGNSNPLSSRALPGLEDLRDDPVGALGKGWGFLGAALGAVGKTVNESVLQPTLERASDPALQSQLSAFTSRATTTLGSAARTGGQLLSTGLEQGSTILRRDLGVDVGDLGAHYLDRATGRGAGEGYGRVGEEHAPAGASGQEPGRGDYHDDFFSEQLGAGVAKDNGGFRDMPTVRAGGSSPAPSTSASAPARKLSPPPPSQPQPQPSVEGLSWESLAPQSAARRASPAPPAAAAAKKEAPKKTAEEEEWESW